MEKETINLSDIQNIPEINQTNDITNHNQEYQQNENGKVKKPNQWTQDQPTGAEYDAINKNKIEHPKRKFAIIHGYNGHDYYGNQK